MSLSPSPVEQVNDVVIAHLCQRPTCKWCFNTEVKKKKKETCSAFIVRTEMGVVGEILQMCSDP